MIGQLFDTEISCWELQLLSREMVAPTKAREALKEGEPLSQRQATIRGIVAELLGIQDLDDPIVARTALTVTAPGLMLAIASRETIGTMVPPVIEPDDAQALIDHVTRFALGGIAAIARERGV
jgi:hypothetical protein